MPRRSVNRVRKKQPRKKNKTTRRKKQSVANVLIRGVRDFLITIGDKGPFTAVANVIFGFLSRVIALNMSNGVLVATTANYGLHSVFTVTLANLISRSPLMSKTVTNNVTTFSTPLRDGRVRHLAITARPDSTLSSRSGKWGMCFIPYRSPDDLSVDIGKSGSLTLDQLACMPGSVIKTADKAITVKFSPTPLDGRAYGFIAIEKAYGTVHIAYQLENRPSYPNLTALDFSPSIELAGEVLCAQPLAGQTAKLYIDENAHGEPSITLSNSDFFSESTTVPLDRVQQRDVGSYVQIQLPFDLVKEKLTETIRLQLLTT